MKNTGTLLKEAREKQGLSISEVSMSTKINPKVLNAIEAGNESQLPAKTFLKGFVRSYATYLKLDVDTVMTSLQQDLGEKAEPAAAEKAAAVAQKAEETKAEAKIAASPKLLRGFAVGGILLLIVLIVTVKNIVEKYEREKIIEPVETSTSVALKEDPKEKSVDTAKEETADAAADADENTEETAQPAANTVDTTPTATTAPVPSPVALPATPAPASTSAAEPVANKSPAAVTTTPMAPPLLSIASSQPVKPVVKPEVKAEVKVEAKAEPKSEPKPEVQESASSVSTADNEIIIEALDKVDVSFTINDGPAKKLSLQPDQVHTIKANGKVALDVSDGGAVSVIHNGLDNGPVGDLGKPKKIKFP